MEERERKSNDEAREERLRDHHHHGTTAEQQRGCTKYKVPCIEEGDESNAVCCMVAVRRPVGYADAEYINYSSHNSQVYI